VDEDYQLRYERVAGIDVAKAKADVCTRLPPRVRAGGGCRGLLLKPRLSSRASGPYADPQYRTSAHFGFMGVVPGVAQDFRLYAVEDYTA
jgi:hypothetical protein